MTKFILTLLIFTTSTFSAHSQDPYSRPDNQGSQRSRGINAYDAKHGANTRLGTGCKLSLYGENVYDGICNVGRRDSVTLIDTRTRKYKIVRDDYDNSSGMFYDSNDKIIGPVNARGPCWVSSEKSDVSVRFCAN